MKKKILSLFLSVALLVAACSVMAACGDKETEATTTEAATTTTTEVATTTTTDVTNTTPVVTTTTEPVVTTTPVPVTTTTTETVVTTTTTEDVTTTTVPAVTTQIALNSALDFNDGESCIALLNKATYNKDVVAVETEKDAIVIYSKKNFDKDADKAADFEVTFDLSDTTIKSGYGTYAGRPWYVADTEWNGTHQYMTISFQKSAAAGVKYMTLVFTFDDGKTAELVLNVTGSEFNADAEGNSVVTIDLVKELGKITTNTMPESAWGSVKTVKSLTINALGVDYKTSADASSYVTFKPTAGDSITINHIVFSADFNAAVKYGTDAE